jgi:hypothetical protein
VSYARVKNTPIIDDDEFTTARGEIMRQALIADAHAWYILGGSRDKGIEGTGQQDAADYFPVPMNGSDISGMTVRVIVEVRTDHAGTSVTPMVRDITGGTDLWIHNVAVVTTGWTQVISDPITITAGERILRLQVIKNNASALVYAIGGIYTRG